MTRDQVVEHFKIVIAECGKKEGATDDDIAEAIAKKLPSTKSAKCMHACIGETVGIVSAQDIQQE